MPVFEVAWTPVPEVLAPQTPPPPDWLVPRTPQFEVL